MIQSDNRQRAVCFTRSLPSACFLRAAHAPEGISLSNLRAEVHEKCLLGETRLPCVGKESWEFHLFDGDCDPCLGAVSFFVKGGIAVKVNENKNPTR